MATTNAGKRPRFLLTHHDPAMGPFHAVQRITWSPFPPFTPGVVSGCRAPIRGEGDYDDDSSKTEKVVMA